MGVSGGGGLELLTQHTLTLTDRTYIRTSRRRYILVLDTCPDQWSRMDDNGG